MQASILLANNIQTTYCLKNEKNELLKREEIIWKQISKIEWLQSGDKNTTFSHNKASNRRSRNMIDKIQNSEGIWVNKKDEIEEIILGYFKAIFTSSNPTNLNVVLDLVGLCMTSDMAAALQEPFTEAEALESLH